MNKMLSAVAVLGLLCLSACGSKTDANEKNFGAAISQYFDKKGDLCLNQTKWPVDVSPLELRMQKTFVDGLANKMAVLEAVGLAKSTETVVDATGLDGRPTGVKFKVKRYVLTDAAKPFLKGQVAWNGEKVQDLCWGKMALDKVVKWEGPMSLGDYKEAQVTYTYKIDNQAEWAKNPKVIAAFPFMKKYMDAAGSVQSHHAVKLTSNGWEALGLEN